MADLVIGGNTYKNIDYVQIKKADGTTATFFDSANKNEMQISTSVGYTKGKAWAISAKAKLGIPTTTIIKET